jgi:uncharacterized protein (TIGR04222 family)
MEQNLELQKRLDAYQIDDPKSSFPFSSKLAKEQNWTPEFTQQAIREYKRFCFLAVAAGHPVSPSEIVDEVWHLHLTYSHEYWNHFCPKVLEMPFHHFPSTGGNEETAKFVDWRQKTLESYRTFFGEEPPMPIWGDIKKVTPESDHFQIPKSVVRKTLASVGAILTVVLLTGCAAQLNPFDLRGPEFLMLYALLTMVAFGAGIAIRSRAKDVSAEPMHRGLTPPELALLAYDEIAVLNCLIAKWTVIGVADYEPLSAVVIVKDQSYVSNDPFENAVFEKLRGKESMRLATLRYSCQSELSGLKSDLVRRGLLLSPDRVVKAKLAVPACLGILIPLGAYKVMVGIERERPVGFLIVMIIILMVVAIGSSLMVSVRTLRGDEILTSAQSEKRHLKNLRMNDPNHIPDNFGYAYALFGAAAFATTIHSVPMQRMQPKNGQSSCGGSSCSSGGGDSGSGGDGGGGGCGGGCGGCGG